MKRRILALAAALTLVFALLPAPKAEAAAESINVYNWGQYISDGEEVAAL